MARDPEETYSEEGGDDHAENEHERATYQKGSLDYSGIASVDVGSIASLESAHQLAEMIVDTVREALLVLDLDLNVRAANESFYRLFQVSHDETVGSRIYELGNRQWDIPKLRTLLEELLPESKSFRDYEVEHEFEKIGRRSMVLNARQLDHHALILVAIEDVTDLRRTEIASRRAQQRFDLLVENARDYAVIAMDSDMVITSWSPGAEMITGWSVEEAIGRTGDIIFTAEDRANDLPAKESKRALRRGSSRDERIHVREDGTKFWGVGFVVALLEEDECLGFVKVLRDESERKDAQDALRKLNETLDQRIQERTRRIKELASALTIAEQQERRRISRILHDDLQQTLYGTQMKLKAVRQDFEMGDQKGLLDRLSQVEEWIRESVYLSRNLSIDLSPPVLHSEGLADVFAWLQARMQDLHGLDVEIVADKSFLTPDDDMRVLLFQIVRELLFNVAKHAGVNRAVVELQDIDHHLRIAVTDEGVGFNPADIEARREAEDTFGLFSVRERLGLFGGKVDIQSAPGEGTRVTIEVPLRLE